jgi:hypothetical protein
MPIQTAIDSISNSQGSPFGFKNRIINGNMAITQGAAAATITPAVTSAYATNYPVDRFEVIVGAASKLTTAQSSTAPTGFNFSTLITSTTSYDPVGATEIFAIRHKIEGFNTSDLAFGTVNAQKITVSFWVRSSVTGTFGGSIQNSAANRSYPFNYTINAIDTFEYKTITIPGDTSGTWIGATNGIGITVNFGLGVGATYSGTANAWAAADYRSATSATSVVAANLRTFYITGVQVEKGSTATSFDYRPYGTELALCQRYFEKSYQQGNPIGGSGTGNTGQILYIGTGNSIANGDKIPNTTFKVVKRTAPDVLVWSPNGTSNRLANMSGTDLAASSCTPNVANDSSFFAYQNSGGSVSGTAGCVQFQWSASAEL